MDWITFKDLFALIPALIGAVTALILKPIADYWVARVRDTRIYHSHMADRIRDFRESIAVLDSIRLLRRETFPIDAHVEKVAVPAHMVTAEAIDLGNLSSHNQADGIQLSNLLENISRETRSINASKASGNVEAYYTQIDELSDKMRNLARLWAKEHPRIRRYVKAADTKRKPIMFEDGSKAYGVSYLDEKPTALPET